MPCYTQWDEYLEAGSPAYAEARAVVAAKLESLKHAVDYYYRAAALALPGAYRSTEGGAFGGEEFRIESPSHEEKEVLDRLTHHLACDGVHCTTIYDAVSLLDANVPEQAGYVRVLSTCAFRLRVIMSSELATAADLFTLEPGRWYAAEFMGDDLASDDARRFSPIYVYRVRPLKTGGGLLSVHFWQESHAERAQDRQSTWTVLERTPRLLLARVSDHPVRLAHVRELSWKWLGDRCRIYPKPGELDVQERMGKR